ncbi:MAG: S-layer homology domain-containing protein [Oscillospiraceae bacterium]|nr:S-layer homology domain-containing protein [Oscillospiraceae bacterium]
MKIRRLLLAPVAWALLLALLAGPMPVLADDPPTDDEAIASAISAIEQKDPFSTEVNTEEGAKAAIAEVLSAVSFLYGVTTEVTGSFTPAEDGTPSAPDGQDGSFVFTVEVSKGEGSPASTKSLKVTIPAIPFDEDQHDVNTARDFLGWDNFRGTNTTQTTITANLSLPDSIGGAPGVVISWASSNTTALSNDGKIGTVTANTNVTLTATLSKNGKTADKPFTLTLLANAKTVTVGTQSGTLRAGTSGTVTFPVTTTGIAAGTYPASVSNRPSGVTVQGSVTINASGSGTLTLAGNSTTAIGTTATLRLTIDSTQSNAFTIIITEGDPQVDAIHNWLTWDRIRGSSGQSQNSVSSNLALNVTLPSSHGGTTITTSGTQRVIITWAYTPTNAGFTMNTTTGVISAFPSASTNITLTASITRNIGGSSTITREKSFNITVANDAAANALANWIRWDGSSSNNGLIRRDNAAQGSISNTSGSRYQVTSDLRLDLSIPSRVNNDGNRVDSGGHQTSDLRITWSLTNGTSSATINTDVTSSSIGRVTFPSSGSQNVILTAEIRRGSNSNPILARKEFYLTIMPGDPQTQVNAVRNWLTWTVIRGGNTQSVLSNNSASNRYNVTSNLLLNPAIPDRLDSSGNVVSGSSGVPISGVTISWSLIEGSGLNTNTGAITATSSQNVRLRATITRGGASVTNNTVDFWLTIQPASEDQLAINAAMNWLVWNQIRRHNEASSSATGPYTTWATLTLPTTYLYTPNSSAANNRTVYITWTSDNTSRVTNTGVVYPTSSNTPVKLTAVFTCGAITGTSTANNPNSKTFDLTVSNPGNAEWVRMTRNWLTWDIIRGANVSETTVANNLSLPSSSSEYSTSITWSSSNTSVISNTGVVTLPSSGSPSVTLTATITRGSTTETKTFTLTARLAFAVEETTNSASAQISAANFNMLTQNGTTGFAVSTSLGEISFDAAAAKAIGSAGNVAIDIRRVVNSTLSAAAQTAAGGRPVIELTVKSGNNTVTTFAGGTAVVDIPYNLGAGENQNAIFVNHLSNNGALTQSRGFYQNGRVRFITEHFSLFTISHNPVTFADANAIPTWALGNITFVGARGLFTGNQVNQFMPARELTYAELTAVLSNYVGNQFAPIGTDWAAPHILWGENLGIYGSKTYDYSQPVTRADMAYILYNFIEKAGIRASVIANPPTFTDTGHLGGEYVTAITFLARRGIVTGTGGSNYGPGMTITRDQVASIIANIVRAFGH